MYWAAGQFCPGMAPLRPMAERLHEIIPGPDTTDDLRRAFGRYGTGVTVVTIRTAHGPLGMTANSFSSVSLDPALVLWSPARGSKRHDAFATASHFCVHVLGSDQQALARHFATQGHDFSGFDWEDGLHDVPTFSGCLATFHCGTHAVHPAGDHSLILGHVQRATIHETQAPGLMFDRGRFGQFSARDQ